MPFIWLADAHKETEDDLEPSKVFRKDITDQGCEIDVPDIQGHSVLSFRPL